MADLRPTVAILTYCAHPALAYGTLLTFKTLRRGFPTARVEVYDNGSHPDVRELIMKACADVDATFVGMAPIYWAAHYRWLLHSRPHDGEPLVLVDPDVVFWKSVEDWDFGDALMAGRLMASVRGSQLESHARLHPSLLWIPDVDRVRHALAADGIAPRLEVMNGKVHLWDTFSMGYERNAPSCAAFTEYHLDSFDHLFFGCHLPIIDAQVGASFDVIRDGHAAAAAGNWPALRGAWRGQEAYFNGTGFAKGMEGRALTVAERQLQCMQGIQKRQGMEYPAGELHAAVAALERRVRGVQTTA